VKTISHAGPGAGTPKNFWGKVSMVSGFNFPSKQINPLTNSQLPFLRTSKVWIGERAFRAQADPVAVPCGFFLLKLP